MGGAGRVWRHTLFRNLKTAMISTNQYRSWGNVSKARHMCVPFGWRHDSWPSSEAAANYLLPHGLGRSYGDSCLNDGQALVPTRSLNRFIHFDPASGLLACEAGVSFEEVLSLVVPRGWFLPVTPGTKFVTVGGAIANDVHGKNHHLDGNFGHAVTKFELLRSDGQRILCSPTENSDWFHATIGGMGLTGLITWAEFQLRQVANPYINQEIVKFGNLDEFFALSKESAKDYRYTVSWIDCLASGSALGRGLYIRGNHASPSFTRAPVRRDATKTVPFNFPSWTLNPLTVKLFNFAYYHKQRVRVHRSTQHFDPFFYPLDAIHHWNRIYGKRGFYQYQCVVPYVSGTEAIREILTEITRAGLGSFLAVLKTFGDVPSVGMMSFPRPGVTLALDFPNSGGKVLRLFDRLDRITRDSRGAVYPAKDNRMSGDSFQMFYPQWQDFSKYIDPKFSSSFWRRVTE